MISSVSAFSRPLTTVSFCRRICRAGYFVGIFLTTIILASCASTTGTQPDAGPDYGIYWYGKDDANQLAIPDEVNPYYDSTRPIILFVHGWQPDKAYTHRTMLWEFEGEKSGEMETVDLAAPWIDAGWNLGVFDWGPFADEPFVFDAEAKIWTTEGGQGMRWRDETGSYHAQRGQDISIGELFYQSYIQALSDFSGTELRLAGHSLGNQMAVSLLNQLAEEIEVGDISDNIMPDRLALLDPYWAPVEQEYLAGDRTGDRVRDILEQDILPQGIPVEWYRSSSLTDGSLISDANEELQDQVAFTELRPRYCSQTDQVCKHMAAWQSYFLSFGLPPPPECERSDPESDCLPTGRVVASASTPNTRLTAMMSEPYRWLHVTDPSGNDSTLTRDPGDDWFERKPR